MYLFNAFKSFCTCVLVLCLLYVEHIVEHQNLHIWCRDENKSAVTTLFNSLT